MGRKTTAKAKEKKLKRKEETARIAAKMALIETANAQEDPLSTLAPFKKFERNGLSISISCQKVGQLDRDTVDWAFELTKTNMQNLYDELAIFFAFRNATVFQLQEGRVNCQGKKVKRKNKLCSRYEESEWGWSDKQKKEEMTDDKAWYLIARDLNNNSEPVAMVHFRFDLDNDDEVLYCYEIQLSKCARRKGLGKFMMQILELIAFKTQMKKVMLTALKGNHDAQEFFKKKLKYEIDETSPEESVYEEDDESCSYEILSKKIGVAAKAKTEETSEPSGCGAHCHHHH